MEKNIIKLIEDRAFGVKVSPYGLENGYLDYQTLEGILGDCILNNTIIECYPEYWDTFNGYDNESDVFQYYIISEFGYEFLFRFTDEIVYYNERLNVYLWGVTHFGTAWDYVLTDVKLLGGDE